MNFDPNDVQKDKGGLGGLDLGLGNLIKQNITDEDRYKWKIRLTFIIEIGFISYIIFVVLFEELKESSISN